jgi:signal transduction histidine kinase
MPQDRMPTQFAPASRDAQEDVQQQAVALQVVALLRQLLDAVPELLMILNDKRQIVFANQRLIDFLACKDPKAVYGARPGEILSCVNAAKAPGGCGTSAACRQCGAVLAILSSQQGLAQIQECRIARRLPGEALNLRVSATPFALGGRQYTILCAADISSEKRKAVIERVLFESILSGARTVREEASNLHQAGVEALQAFRDKTLQFSETLIEEINEHRILAAAENDQLRIHPVKVDPLEVLQKIVAFYASRPEAQGRALRIQCQVSGMVPMVTDPTLLKQILDRMIRNALEACAAGDTVTLGFESSKSAVEFSVHNPGYIPREVQQQIFQRGFSTKGDGRGVGTYAMKLLSEKYLKGKVSLVSTRNVGTTCRASFPLDL